MFASLAFRSYRLWFLVALVANVGTWMLRLAQDWLVLVDLTDDSAVAVGVTTALQFAPSLLLSPWAGLLADRVDRRTLLMATQGAQAVLAAGLGVLVISGWAELWHVYVFASLLGCVSAFDGPARMTFVADVVPAERLSNAVGLNGASFNIARLVGPAVAGLMIAAVGSGPVFLVNAVSFVAATATLGAIRRTEMIPQGRAPRRRGQIREGLVYVRGRRDLVLAMVVVAAVSTFALSFQLTSVVMARAEFGRGAEGYGLLGSVLAAGSLAGALLAARRERPRLRVIFGGALGFAAATAALAVAPTFGHYLVACALLGFTSLTVFTAASAMIQVTTEPAVRGRVMALYMVVFFGGAPIASPLIGWVAQGLGARWATALGAVVPVVVVATALLRLRGARALISQVPGTAHLRRRPVTTAHPAAPARRDVPLWASGVGARRALDPRTLHRSWVY